MQETITQTKVCSKCNLEKHIDMFYKQKNCKDGIRPKCKQCMANDSKKYNESNKDKLKQYFTEYYLNNKTIKNIQTKEYYQKNKKEISIYHKKYRIENLEKIRIVKKKYYEKNRELINKKITAYYKTERGKASIKNQFHKRRSLKKQGDVTTQQLMELEKTAKVCYWCSASLKNKKIHIDHYVPLSKGGEHTLSNLVISCAKCNHKKSAIDPLRFANTLGRLL